jgi:signal transduction histidine kinase
MGNDTDIPEMEGYELWPASLVAKRHPGLQCNLEPEEAEKENLALGREYAFADSDHLHELIEQSESGELQNSSLAQLYENRQAHAVSLLNEQLQTLNMQRLEAQRLQVQILDDQLYESSYNPEDGWNVSEESLPRSDLFIGDDGPGSWNSLPTSECSTSELEGDHSVEYWRDRARGFSKLLAESIRREEILEKRLQEFTSAASPMQHLEELGLQPNRFDDFLRFCLKKAPIIIAHQDAELRYRFIYNAFPTLTEEEVIGKTDMEILSGVGIMEVVEFKKEVMRKGWPEKREFTFNTDLFGEKTFLIALEPVMNKLGQPIGLNYISVDISDQVDKREQLMCLREEGAVQKAMETELNRTIHITEETMRAKQMLATMSHEIRSPLSGVVSVAEVLATTCLDAEQRGLVDVMLSSGDLVLQLINDILDLSKVESGAMQFEAKKFRFREVVKHVLQTAAASVQNKRLDLQESVNDDVPPEVIGDVLRIRQVFTNLVRYKYITDIDRKLGVLFLLESQNIDFFDMDTELTSLFPSQVLNATFREFLGLFNISCVLNSTCSHVHLFI